MISKLKKILNEASLKSDKHSKNLKHLLVFRAIFDLFKREDVSLNSNQKNWIQEQISIVKDELCDTLSYVCRTFDMHVECGRGLLIIRSALAYISEHFPKLRDTMLGVHTEVFEEKLNSWIERGYPNSPLPLQKPNGVSESHRWWKNV